MTMQYAARSTQHSARSISGAARGTVLFVLCVLCVLAPPAPAQTRTTIRDVLYSATGTRVSGQVEISWDAFTSADGKALAAGKVAKKITDGLLEVQLVPNVGAIPAGTSYAANYALTGGTNYLETWVVPPSGTAVTLSAVRVSVPPVRDISIAQQQLTLGSGLTTQLGLYRSATPPVASAAGQMYCDTSTTPCTPMISTGPGATYVALGYGGAATPDADATTKGKLKLAGDLDGTADLPTVPGLAGRVSLTGSYADPGWIASLAASKLTGRVPNVSASSAEDWEFAFTNSYADGFAYVTARAPVSVGFDGSNTLNSQFFSTALNPEAANTFDIRTGIGWGTGDTVPIIRVGFENYAGRYGFWPAMTLYPDGSGTFATGMTITGAVDASGAASTIPVKSGTLAARSATCIASVEMYNVTDPAAAGQQLYVCNAAGTGWDLLGGGGGTLPSIVTGDHTFTGSVLFKNGSPWVDVKAWGAVGNDTGDQSTAIQSAIDATGHGTLFFPSGTYRIAHTLFIRPANSGMRLVFEAGNAVGPGAGTVIMVAPNLTPTVDALVIQASDVVFEAGLTIDGYFSTAPGGCRHGIVAYHSVQGVIGKVRVQNCRDDGISVDEAAYGNTTVAANIGTGEQTVTPASMAPDGLAISYPVILAINRGEADYENVLVTASTANTFTATFTQGHTGPVNVGVNGSNDLLLLRDTSSSGNGGWGVHIVGGSDANGIVLDRIIAVGNGLGGALVSGINGRVIGGMFAVNGGPPIQLGETGGGAATNWLIIRPDDCESNVGGDVVLGQNSAANTIIGMPYVRGANGTDIAFGLGLGLGYTFRVANGSGSVIVAPGGEGGKSVVSATESYQGTAPNNVSLGLTAKGTGRVEVGMVPGDTSNSGGGTGGLAVGSGGASPAVVWAADGSGNVSSAGTIYHGPPASTFTDSIAEWIAGTPNVFATTSGEAYAGLAGIAESTTAPTGLNGVANVTAASSDGAFAFNGNASASHSEGTVAYVVGGSTMASNTGAGTVANLIDMWLFGPANLGAGTVNYAYGLRIDDVTAGAAGNWAIYTGQGKVHFGGTLDAASTDFSSAASTTPVKSGALTARPATCAASVEMYNVTDPAAAGQQLYVCNAAGTGWNLVGDGGGGGGGDVSGPGSSVSGNFASFNGTGGKTIQDSGSKAADFAVAGHNHSGTYAPAFSSQNAATILAGPATGDPAAPAFRALVATDVPTLNQSTTGNATTATTADTANGGDSATAFFSTGTLEPTIGGTGQATWTLGDLLYGSGTNTLAKLVGNITTTNKFLCQTGTGSISAIPGWCALIAADIPDISGTYSVTGHTHAGYGLTTTPATAGTAPAFIAGVLNLPMASAASVTAGLLSKTDYDVFNGKPDLVAAGSAGIAAFNAGNGTTASRSDHTHRSFATLSWFFPGVVVSGTQTARSLVPEDAANCTITNSRISVGTVSGASSTYNIARCTTSAGNCTATANIYSSAVTLNSSTQSVAGGAPNTATVTAGDAFIVTLTPGASLADVTVAMTYKCEVIN